MNEPSWEQSKKKQGVRRIIISVVVLCLAGIVVYNNRDALPMHGLKSVLQRWTPKTKPANQSVAAASSTDSMPGGVMHKPEQGPAAAPVSIVDTMSFAKPLQTITFAAVRSVVFDRPDLSIVMNVDCQFSDVNRRKEILFKREELRGLIVGSVGKLALSEMKPAVLAPLVKKELNRILKNEPILNIVIRDCTLDRK